MNVSIGPANESDAAAIAALRTRVAEDLAGLWGRGHWAWAVTERSVLRGMKHSRILIARAPGGGPSASDRTREIVATVRLTTKKPWAIDGLYFSPVPRAIYLVEMAVAPDAQRLGIGRQVIVETIEAARAWSGDAIRLCAYDAALGAGPFYTRCGFREVGRVTYRLVPLVYFEWVLRSPDDACHDDVI